MSSTTRFAIVRFCFVSRTETWLMMPPIVTSSRSFRSGSSAARVFAAFFSAREAS